MLSEQLSKYRPGDKIKIGLFTRKRIQNCIPDIKK